MRPGIEQACALLWCDLLAPLAESLDLQVVPFLSDVDLQPQRLVVHCRDDGEDNSMRGPDGCYFRRLSVTIALHGCLDDKGADWLAEATAAIEAALYPPYSAPESLALFDGLEIYEIGGQELKFDKNNWTKLFTVQMGGHLK